MEDNRNFDVIQATHNEIIMNRDVLEQCLADELKRNNPRNEIIRLLDDFEKLGDSLDKLLNEDADYHYIFNRIHRANETIQKELRNLEAVLPQPQIE